MLNQKTELKTQSSELNQKTELEKPQKSQKMTPKWLQKSEGILGEMPIGAPLVVQTVFLIKKWVHSAAKVFPRLEK